MEDIQKILIAIADREAESAECGLDRWDVPLWDGIHFWAAGLDSKAMKKHVAALLKKWGRVLPQVDAVVWIERVVSRAIAAERARVRRDLLAEIEDIREHEEYASCVDGSERERWVVERESLFAALDRVCPEEK